MIAAGLPDQLQRTTSLRDAYHLLLAWPTFGPFLAFQYAIDLNYTPLLAHNEHDFVVPGPGALDGLAKCFHTLGDLTPAEAILWLVDCQHREFTRYGLAFDGLWGRPLQPIDVQNLLCEVSKYTRVTHPGFLGRSGRTRIKQRFKPAGVLPRPFFPPNWGLQPRIEAWFRAAQPTNNPPVAAQPTLPWSDPDPLPRTEDHD